MKKGDLYQLDLEIREMHHESLTPISRRILYDLLSGVAIDVSLKTFGEIHVVPEERLEEIARLVEKYFSVSVFEFSDRIKTSKPGILSGKVSVLKDEKYDGLRAMMARAYSSQKKLNNELDGIKNLGLELGLIDADSIRD